MIVRILLALCLVVFSIRKVRADGFAFFRYDDDFTYLADPALRTSPYDDFKYIPIGDAPDRYISLGADLRERVESYDYGYFGLAEAPRTTYLLSRALADVDVHYGDVRAFLQLANEVEDGRKPGALPTDDNRGDVQQGFIDFAPRVGSGRLTLRAGRFEMKFGEGLLVSPREGPNIRQAWDGGWGFYQIPGLRIDVLAVRPVIDNPGYFNDVTDRTQSLWGAYLTAAPEPLGRYAVDVYDFGNVNHEVAIYTGSGGPGSERTNTAGGRIYGHLGAFDSTNEAIIQTGHFNTRDVRAFAFHNELGWTFKTVDWTPRVGLKADALSGSRNPRSGTVGTFNPLYPNYSYSTDAVLEAPANLIQAGVDTHVYPRDTIDVEYTAAGLWRYSTRDAFYAMPFFPLIPGDAGRERYTGVEQQLAANWRPNAYLTLRASVAHFSVGPFVTGAHGRDTNFAMFYVAAHL